MPESRLADPEYRNWSTVGRAIQITSGGLQALVQNAVDKYHTSLLASTSLPKNLPAWKTYLTNAHRSTDKRKICWSNSDATQWLTVGASWEIAKIFMAPLGPMKLDVVNAQTTDISGLLNVLEWSSRGPNGIFNTGVSLSKIADARSARNTWAHAPSLHISDGDKANAFAVFTSLLQDPELCHDKDVQDAMNELGGLVNAGLAVTEENELEVLVQLRRELGKDVVSLKSHLAAWKGQVDANYEQIQEQRKYLEEFLKKNELQNAFETVEKRINGIEEQIIEDLQCTNSGVEKLDENVTNEPQHSVDDGKSSTKFNPVCDRMKEEFVGREWLFNTIDSWLKKDLEPSESGAFLIWGGPGTGKSSFARELIRRHKGKKLAAFHYFQNDNPLTYDAPSLVLDLNKKLSESLPDYAASIEQYELLTTCEQFRHHPEKLFDALITTPLQQLPENAKQFLVIDALDEGGSTVASCFAKLSAKLPPWLRVILTARHEASDLSNLFPDSSFASLDHFKNSPQSLLSLNEDIREFVAMKYRKLQSEYLTIPPFFANNEQAANEKIVEASQNCFLYAKLVMEHIFAGHDEIGLPVSLSDVYCLDFRRRFPDVDFFEKKVAPVLEIALAIVPASVQLYKDGLMDNMLISMITSSSDRTCFSEDEELLTSVVHEGHLLSGFCRRDLDKAFQLLSGYLIKNITGPYHFSHSSVSDWLQDEKSDFFCDVTKGHLIMATFFLETLKKRLPPDDGVVYRNSIDVYARLLCQKSFFIRHLFHSSFLPKRGGSHVNVLLSELGIKAMNLLVSFTSMRMGGPHPAPIFGPSEYLVMKVLDETDVLFTMDSKTKTEYLRKAIEANCTSVIDKFFNCAYWLFSSGVLSAIAKEGAIEQALKSIQKKGLSPQLFFSLLCCEDFLMISFNLLLAFCFENGVTADVCVPTICKNTKNFEPSVCWNEDAQEYFRGLKSGKKNVITLESLKEIPSHPHEAKIDGFTLKIIQEPLSEVERLVRDGECFIQFKYAWHEFFKKQGTFFVIIDHFLKNGANVSNRGSFGVTGLMYACQKKDDRFVSFFLERGAAVNQQNFFGSTALHYAVKVGDDNSKVILDIIEMLLQHKADPYLKNSLGVSAIDLAKKKKKVGLEKLMIDRATCQR